MKGKRVLMVGNYEPDRQYSMIGYQEGLRRGLLSRGWHVDVSRPAQRVNRSPSARLGKWAGYIDKMVLYPRHLAREQRSYDLVHVIDQGNGFYGKVVARQNHLFTNHDLLAIRASLGDLPGFDIGATGTKLQQMILDGLRQCRNFVSISQQSYRDLERLHPRLAFHQVVLNGMIKPMTKQTRENVDVALKGIGLPASTSYFFAIGAGPYKNQVGIVKLFSSLIQTEAFANARLVVVTRGFDAAASELAEREGVTNRLTLVADASEAAVEALYSGALALLFPSRIEGFGLPIIEAQTCGCPVVTSNREPMIEVAGPSAILVDPDNPAQGVPTILARWRDVTKWVADGHDNVKRFSFDRWIDDYAKVYDSLLT